MRSPQVNNVLVRYLTAEQETRLLEHLPLQYKPVVKIALNTGLRQGELLRLTWSDCDWNAGILTVQETKAGEKRRMPMNSTVLGLLVSLKPQTSGQPTDRVFPYGATLSPTRLRQGGQGSGIGTVSFP